ncbi:RNA dependent RNA polymerase-domain-containing protein [Cladochytrium replicatum]|nr:RNA dependent RNA polymerase-domain-containing protein [Cladochytrium replicatum]
MTLSPAYAINYLWLAGQFMLLEALIRDIVNLSISPSAKEVDKLWNRISSLQKSELADWRKPNRSQQATKDKTQFSSSQDFHQSLDATLPRTRHNHRPRFLYLLIHSLEDSKLTYRVRLPVRGVSVYGCADNTGPLRFPSYHPNDIRILEAVKNPPAGLEHVRDAIVFPTNGLRPHADEMSGGDLDGDKFGKVLASEIGKHAVGPSEVSDLDEKLMEMIIDCVQSPEQRKISLLQPIFKLNLDSAMEDFFAIHTMCNESEHHPTNLVDSGTCQTRYGRENETSTDHGAVSLVRVTTATYPVESIEIHIANQHILMNTRELLLEDPKTTSVTMDMSHKSSKKSKKKKKANDKEAAAQTVENDSAPESSPLPGPSKAETEKDITERGQDNGSGESAANDEPAAIESKDVDDDEDEMTPEKGSANVGPASGQFQFWCVSHAPKKDIHCDLAGG